MRDDRKRGTQQAAPDGLVRRYAPGARIFDRGDAGGEFFVILAGEVSIRATAADGSELARLRGGEFFGEMSIVDQRPRSAAALAGPEGAELMAMDAPRFVYLVSQQPGFAMLIMERLSLLQRGEASASRPAPSVAAWPARPYAVERIAEDCVQLSPRSRSANAYLFRGPKRNVLIDTCLPSSAEHLHRALAETGVAPGEIDMILLTHEHFDHTGAIPSFGGRPLVGALGLAANKIRLSDEFATMTRAFEEEVTPFDVDIEIAPGMVIDTGRRRLRVYHTPGHSSGGASFFDETEGLLVAGDTVMKGGPIGGIFGSGNISDLHHSLSLLGALRPAVLLPGHGPVSDTPQEDIALTKARCAELLSGTQALFDALHPHKKVQAIVNAFRDLNRSYMQG